MIARWSSPAERSRCSILYQISSLDYNDRFTAFSYAGSAFGTVISMPACGYLCEACLLIF